MTPWASTKSPAAPGVDATTGAATVISYGHHEVHGGSAFMFDTVDLSMANAETIVVAFKTGAAPKHAHLVIEFAALVAGHMDIVEAPTWDNQSGTLKTIYNRRRATEMVQSFLLEDQGQADFVASGNLNLNPTTFAGGTIIRQIYAFGLKNFATAGSRDLTETILKPDTQYGIRFTADGNSNAGYLSLEWYEHTDRS